MLRAEEAAGNEPVSFTHDRYHGNTCEHVRAAEVKADWPCGALVSGSGGVKVDSVGIGVGLRGFTWADSLDEQKLFLERICAFRH